MSDNPTNINLLNGLSTAEIRYKSFKADDGSDAAYTRLALGGTLNGEDVEVELKVDKKDVTILKNLDKMKGSLLDG